MIFKRLRIFRVEAAELLYRRRDAQSVRRFITQVWRKVDAPQLPLKKPFVSLWKEIPRASNARVGVINKRPTTDVEKKLILGPTRSFVLLSSPFLPTIEIGNPRHTRPKRTRWAENDRIF